MNKFDNYLLDYGFIEIASFYEHYHTLAFSSKVLPIISVNADRILSILDA